ncbi:hypothetical protein NW762_011941 [Fusarium torreyae]|uniref:Nephrocystin 3-like N-terminal domain-containing protein n=1 Tax=Fusarium torreyae TaxID=1237075 RepID=A0A9W8RNB5_9HYPO|nr:hypothetical protein NW762_011941 [Fusarium torreyae]
MDATIYLYERWGDSVGLSQGKLSDDHHPGLDDPKTILVVRGLLNSINEFLTTSADTTGGRAPQRTPSLSWFDESSSSAPKTPRWQKAAWALPHTIRDLRVWLGSPSPNDLFDESKKKRLDQTCEWILHREAFQQWRKPSASAKLLWIKGPAGFGKTILCAKMVQEIDRAATKPMAYFFLSSKFDGRDDLFLVVRSWLMSVTLQSTVAFDIVSKTRLSQHEHTAPRSTILRLFRDVLIAVSGCTFILDGLDECTGITSSDTNPVSHFLDELRQAVTDTSTNLLICSRGEPVIEQELSLFPGYSAYDIQLEDVGPDLMVYSTEIVKTKLPNEDEPTREFIAGMLKDRCQGQFQWIKLQEGSLRKGRSRKQLEREIEATPPGLDSLYDREWNRLNSMRDTDRERTLSLLRWAAFATRPLTVCEITEAVLINADCAELPRDEMPDPIDEDYIQDMISNLCGSLIDVRHPILGNEESKEHMLGQDPNVTNRDGPLEDIALESFVGDQEIHLTHFSVKEYLLLKLHPGNGLLSNERLRVSNELENMALAKACLRYIGFRGVWDDQERDDIKDSQKYLFHYATTQWARHYNLVQNPDSDLVNAIYALFDGQNPNWQSWKSWIESWFCEAAWPDEEPTTMSPIHLAIVLEMKDTIIYLLKEKKADLEVRFGRDMTALHLACMRELKEIVELLLDNGAEIDARDVDGKTPLYYAVETEDCGIIQLLIDKGANPSITTTDGETSLHQASQLGNLDVAQLLLENGSDVTAVTAEGCTPLYFASANGYTEIVRLFVERGADCHSVTCNGYTPVVAATASNFVDVVELLLDRGAGFQGNGDINNGMPLLSLAAAKGYHDLSELLIKKGADTNEKAVDCRKLTPLAFASWQGNVDIVQLLLEKGADVNPRAQHRVVPIHYASYAGNLSVVELLLEKGADANATDHSGRTALFWAADCGHVSLVDFFITFGHCDVATHDKSYRTSLHYACKHGHQMVVKTLLAQIHGQREIVDGRDYWGSTPLSMAVRRGHVHVVKLLLDTNIVDINSQDNFGRTLVDWAKRQGHSELVDLLDKEQRHHDPGAQVLTPLRKHEEFEYHCDICEFGSSEARFQSCGICHAGDFDVCLECFALGGHCYNSEHKLVLTTR